MLILVRRRFIRLMIVWNLPFLLFLFAPPSCRCFVLLPSPLQSDGGCHLRLLFSTSILDRQRRNIGYAFRRRRRRRNNQPHRTSHALLLLPETELCLVSPLREEEKDDKQEKGEAKKISSTPYNTRQTSDPTKMDAKKLKNDVRRLLDRPIGSWTIDDCHHVNSLSYPLSMQLHNPNNSKIHERLLVRTIEEIEFFVSSDENQTEGRDAPVSVLDMASMYRSLLKSWARSGTLSGVWRAEEILDHLQKAYENGDISLKPGIESFNVILHGYATTGIDEYVEEGSKPSMEELLQIPQQTIRFLQKFHRLHEMGRTDITPTAASYSNVLHSYASTGARDAPALVKNIIRRMEELSNEGYPHMSPTCREHNEYLLALRNAISRYRELGAEYAKEAHSHLQWMLSCSDESVKPTTKSFNIVLSALSKNGESNAVDKAMKLVTQLEEYHGSRTVTREKVDFDFDSVGFDSDTTEPDTITYNRLLACIARSEQSDRGKLADEILDRMKEFERQGHTARKPDASTYTTVMQAYVGTGPSSVHRVDSLLMELCERYDTTRNVSLRPDQYAFNVCCSAWEKSNYVGAARRIVWIMKSMREFNERWGTTIEPDTYTYNAYLGALLKEKTFTIVKKAEAILSLFDLPEGVKLSTSQPSSSTFLTTSEEEDDDDDDDANNKNKNNNNDRVQGNRTSIIDVILSTRRRLVPEVKTFTRIMQCILPAGGKTAVRRVYDILETMEELSTNGTYPDLKPTSVTYATIIMGVAKSRLKKKAEIAVEFLERMERSGLEPNPMTYNSVLNACVFSKPKNSEECVTLLRTGKTIYAKALEKSSTFHFITFILYLRVLQNFQKDREERTRCATDVFHRCCQEGHLTEAVLNELKLCLSYNDFTSLRLIAIDDQTGRLRNTFTRNVITEYQRNDVSGRNRSKGKRFNGGNKRRQERNSYKGRKDRPG